MKQEGFALKQTEFPRPAGPLGGDARCDLGMTLKFRRGRKSWPEREARDPWACWRLGHGSTQEECGQRERGPWLDHLHARICRMKMGVPPLLGCCEHLREEITCESARCIADPKNTCRSREKVQMLRNLVLHCIQKRNRSCFTLNEHHSLISLLSSLHICLFLLLGQKGNGN